MQEQNISLGTTISNHAARETGGACNTAPRSVFAAETEADTLQTDAAAIPPERLAKMQAYAKALRVKHPQMKPDRLQRKVAEYFKVKLI